MFEGTNEDGSSNGMLDDPLGEFSKLGFEGTTIAEAEAYLRTIPASANKATTDEIQTALADHWRKAR
jgi:hypothetical protein